MWYNWTKTERKKSVSFFFFSYCVFTDELLIVCALATRTDIVRNHEKKKQKKTKAKPKFLIADFQVAHIFRNIFSRLAQHNLSVPYFVFFVSMSIMLVYSLFTVITGTKSWQCVIKNINWINFLPFNRFRSLTILDPLPIMK